MGTFRIHQPNRTVILHFVKQAQTNCVSFLTKLLTTMAWAIVVVAIMMIFGLMLFAKIMAT